MTAGITGFNWQPLRRGIVSIALQRLENIYLTFFYRLYTWKAWYGMLSNDWSLWISVFSIGFSMGFFIAKLQCPCKKKTSASCYSCCAPPSAVIKKGSGKKRLSDSAHVFPHTFHLAPIEHQKYCSIHCICPWRASADRSGSACLVPKSRARFPHGAVAGSTGQWLERGGVI